MNTLFSRWLPGTTLASWSAVLLYFHLSGRISAFLVPVFRPYVLVAGLILALMALVLLASPAQTACCSSSECGHPLSRKNTGKALTFLVLLLPITVSALFSPDAFGRKTIENRGIITDASAFGPAPRRDDSASLSNVPVPAPDTAVAPPEPGKDAAPASGSESDYLQRTPDGHILAEVMDMLYAAQDTALRKDFEGKTVELVGQLMPESTGAGARPRIKVVRMFMTCCAADARPVATLAECESLPGLPDMTWIKVTGTATFPLEKGRRVAVIAAKSVVKTDPPEETMLY